ncbi:glycosyltransferase [Natronorubrum thiooxidans]|uniref:Glycosyltransferase involved in cell wall bisynthesis n=1 Tax=Natronorubrum thiooxidans TaxID=308853 RepID=A0A1N7GCW8_9EURY|nr:glycosyltransferase [Natronorubrum thiooxidans]SIS10413.1 Glycosyltransferase involved in cell wall bisynthesis [Natronorubrum thiooxidans]
MGELDALFLTKYDRKGASSRYRSLQYFPHLEEAGINCSHAPLFSNAYLETLYETGERPLAGVVRSYLRRLRDLLTVREYDVIVLEKELLPYAPALFERLLGRLETPYIVDYDDAIFHNYDRSGNPLVRTLLGTKIDVVMREADAAVAGNEYLASRARKAGASRVEIVPTVIDLEKYPHVPPSEDGPFTIGWIGSPTTAQYVEAISPALRAVCDRRDARVVLVGSGAVELPGVPLEVREWSEETEVEDIAEFDVGIMPLVDTPWERGKCGFKLIQYMACGKPVVASPVGVSAEIAEEDMNGLHAESLEEWTEGLMALCDDWELAQRMGERGRERVETEYCLTVTEPKWTQVLREVAG